MDKPLALGRALHLVRSRHKLTRRQLVERALAVETGYDGEGLSPSSLNRSENGERSPRVHELMAICEATGITLVDFFQLYQSLVADEASGAVPHRSSPLSGSAESDLGRRVHRLLADLEVDLDAESARLHVHLHLPPDWSEEG